MEKIKDYINVTIFKNRKPTYDYSRQFTVGDRGIIWKITFAYDKNKTIESILFSINDCDIYNYSISELHNRYFVKIDNMYINYIANKQIPDNLHDIFINKIIDIEKQNGYNKLNFEKNKILQECIGVYCMELEYKYDSTPIKLKEWYNNELHKIDNYTNLSKKLEIYPYEVIFE